MKIEADSKTEKRKTTVLVVEDSLPAQKILVSIIDSDPNLEVIAVAGSGEEALAKLEEIKPDVITMDVHLPGMDGLAATRKIMEFSPVPIIVVSASTLVTDIERAFELIEAGALTAVAKPINIGTGDFKVSSKLLIQTIKSMANVKVVKRNSRGKLAEKKNFSQTLEVDTSPLPTNLELIAIGASTGGPKAVQQILSKLSLRFPLPIILVQHISPGFTAGMKEWFSQNLKLKVKIAEEGEKLRKSFLYLSEEDKHITVLDGRFVYSNDATIAGHRPSVARLFQSVAQEYGERSLGIILTGMGVDGAAELLQMKERGATTIAQSAASSIVHGMPGKAIELGAATHVMNLEEIASGLLELEKRIRSINNTGEREVAKS